MKVLVADDNATIRLMLDKLLSSWGYEVVLAEDGNQAMAVLRDSNPPQIAILDWSMPGKTGVEICAECEKSDSFVYRMLLTAREKDEDMMYGLDHGAHDFQHKPIAPGILRSRLAVAKRLVDAMQQVMRSERLAAVGSLVAGVAHHFNNLNLPILMYASSVLKKGDIDENTRRKVEKIEKAAQQAGALTERLMAVASNKEQKRALVDLNALVTEAIEIESITFKESGILVEKKLGDIPEILAVPSDISHLITNLLGNASHALLASAEKRITVQTARENGHVCLSVTDTGCGIAANKLHRIFSPFHTEKGEFAPTGSPLKDVRGAGIGLYAARRIATDHRGEITVESQLGKGSTFTLLLPATQS